MLRRGLCLLLTAALCLTTGCVADRAAMQAEAEQALLAQQEEALRQEEAERPGPAGGTPPPGRGSAARRDGGDLPEVSGGGHEPGCV